jgi:hypothetical protein
LRNAYAMREHADAKRALDSLLHQLMHLNPSAARSLEEGMDETLTVHQLRVPPKLRSSVASTNLIESAFSIVETVCRHVKRWQGGDQHLRWVASGLLWAESSSIMNFESLVSTRNRASSSPTVAFLAGATRDENRRDVERRSVAFAPGRRARSAPAGIWAFLDSARLGTRATCRPSMGWNKGAKAD